MKKLLATGAASLLSASGFALASAGAFAADDHTKHAGHQDPAKPVVTAQAVSAMSEAEVRTINKDAGKITFKHGEIKNLDMGAMTMVFQVKDAALLDKVKEGDKVQFTAEKIRGQYTVTSIEKK